MTMWTGTCNSSRHCLSSMAVAKGSPGPWEEDCLGQSSSGCLLAPGFGRVSEAMPGSSIGHPAMTCRLGWKGNQDEPACHQARGGGAWPGYRRWMRDGPNQQAGEQT